MNLNKLDSYVREILHSNGWNENRHCDKAEDWIKDLEQRGRVSFPFAYEVLVSFGGLKIQEYFPKTHQVLKEYGRFKNNCRNSREKEMYQKSENALEILCKLNMEQFSSKYTGATFGFDPLEAIDDEEIVMCIDLAQSVVNQSLFPIGTVAPDGVVYAAPNQCIYVLFDDSIFLAGNGINDYLNRQFLRESRPQLIYKLNLEF